MIHTGPGFLWLHHRFVDDFCPEPPYCANNHVAAAIDGLMSVICLREDPQSGQSISGVSSRVFGPAQTALPPAPPGTRF